MWFCFLSKRDRSQQKRDGNGWNPHISHDQSSFTSAICGVEVDLAAKICNANDRTTLISASEIIAPSRTVSGWRGTLRRRAGAACHSQPVPMPPPPREPQQRFQRNCGAARPGCNKRQKASDDLPVRCSSIRKAVRPFAPPPRIRRISETDRVEPTCD